MFHPTGPSEAELELRFRALEESAPGDTAGQFAAASAFLLGAHRVIVIDHGTSVYDGSLAGLHAEGGSSRFQRFPQRPLSDDADDEVPPSLRQQPGRFDEHGGMSEPGDVHAPIIHPAPVRQSTRLARIAPYRTRCGWSPTAR